MCFTDAKRSVQHFTHTASLQMLPKFFSDVQPELSAINVFDKSTYCKIFNLEQLLMEL